MSVDLLTDAGAQQGRRYFRNAAHVKIRQAVILGKHNYDRYLAILSEGTEPL